MNKPHNREVVLSTKGVSIITCTQRADYLETLLQNFTRQSWQKKELILILNNDQLSIEAYQEKIEDYKNHGNIALYQLPESTTLGECLNYAVSQVNYPYIAKFDDDDYYGARYLVEMMDAFRRTEADVIGKGSYYLYLMGKKLLIIRNPYRENRFVNSVAGGTLLFKKDVLDHVSFPHLSLGEDVQFLQDCKVKGFKIYSTSKGNFLAFRRINLHHHTWKISEEELLKYRCKVVGPYHHPNIKRVLSRIIKQVETNECRQNMFR